MKVGKTKCRECDKQDRKTKHIKLRNKKKKEGSILQGLYLPTLTDKEVTKSIISEKKVPVAREYSNTTSDTSEKEHYDNQYNIHDGYSYDGSIMKIDGKNLPEAVSYSAFNLMNHYETSIQLGQKDFDTMFDDYNAVSFDKDKNTINKEEFLNYYKVYAQNAKANAKKENTQREKVETVDVDPIDQNHLSNFYDAMAGDDRLIGRKEFTSFHKEMFDKYASDEDATLTRAEQLECINEKLDKLYHEEEVSYKTIKEKTEETFIDTALGEMKRGFSSYQKAFTGLFEGKENKATIGLNEWLDFNTQYVRKFTPPQDRTSTSIQPEHMTQMYDAMAGKDKLLEQKEFDEFFKDMYKADPSADAKVLTLDEQKEFMAKWNAGDIK